MSTEKIPVKTLLMRSIQECVESIPGVSTVLLNPPSGTTWDACLHPLCIIADMNESFKLTQNKVESTFQLQLELYTEIDTTLDNMLLIDTLYAEILIKLQTWSRENKIWDYAKKINCVSATRIYGYNDFNGYLMNFDVDYLTVRGNPYNVIL